MLNCRLTKVKYSKKNRPCRIWQDAIFAEEDKSRNTGSLQGSKLALLRFQNYYCAYITIKQKIYVNKKSRNVSGDDGDVSYETKEEVTYYDEAKSPFSGTKPNRSKQSNISTKAMQGNNENVAKDCEGAQKDSSVPSSAPIFKWKTVLKKYRLMRHPHFENDAQDWHTLHIGMLFNKNWDPTQLTSLRFYLIQPSSNWLKFELRCLSFETIAAAQKRFGMMRSVTQHTQQSWSRCEECNTQSGVSTYIEGNIKKNNCGHLVANHHELPFDTMENNQQKSSSQMEDINSTNNTLCDFPAVQIAALNNTTHLLQEQLNILYGQEREVSNIIILYK